MRIGTRLFEAKSYVIVAWDLKKMPPVSDNRGDFKKIPFAELATSPEYTESGIPPPGRPYDEATHCWVETDSGRLIAWHCLAPEAAPFEDWLLVRIGTKDGIWTLGTWVDPDHRGRRVAVRIRNHGAHWSLDHYYTKVFGWIRTSNRSNLRSARRNGFEPIARLFVMRLGGLCLVRHGRRILLGRWTTARPLVLPLEISEIVNVSDARC